MEILSATDEGIRFLGLVGSYDTTDVEAFQAHVETAIDEQVFKIVVNMGQLTFINSTALGSLIRAQKRLKQYGGDLAVAEPSPFAAQVFRTLGIDRKIRCLPSEAQALEYLRTVGIEGVNVEGEQKIAFTFVDPQQTAAAGTEPRVAELKRLSEHGVTFQWENLDGLDAEQMFVPNAPVRLRFSIPLYHESHMFHADGSIVRQTVTAGNRSLVEARFTGLRDVERRAIQQYVSDIRYLKGELQ